MNIWDILIIALVAAAAVAAVIIIIKKKKHRCDGCCGSCSADCEYRK